MTGIKKQTHTHTYTHIKYKPWRKLGRILRGRCTRASRVPRGSIAGQGPWPTGTARWCPPEKHGWQFHSAPSVEEIAAANEIAQVARYHLSMEWEYESERWKGGGCGPIRWMEFTMEDKKRKRAEATHAPLPPFLSNFPAAACCPAKFNPRVLIFVEDAVSKWFPADRRRDALGHPLSLSSIKIRRSRELDGVVSKRYVSANDSEEGRGKGFWCCFCSLILVSDAERSTTKFILGCCARIWCLAAEGIWRVYGGCINLSFSKR